MSEPFYSASSRILVGRHQELTSIAQWEKSGAPPLIVVGPPGVGKTALLQSYFRGRPSSKNYAKDAYLYGRQFESAESLLRYLQTQLPEDVNVPDNHRLIIIDGLDEIPFIPLVSADFVLRLHEIAPSTRWLLSSRPSGFMFSWLLLHHPESFTILKLDDLPENESLELLLRRLQYTGYSGQHFILNKWVDTHSALRNPRIILQMAEKYAESGNLDEVFETVAKQLSDGLTNILVVPNRGHLLAIPATQLQAYQVMTPTNDLLWVAPYVAISRLSSFWRRQLEEFEKMLNDVGAKEHDFQLFFERNPLFLQGIDYKSVIPHPVLEREPDVGNLVPDFLLQPLESQYSDILDLKLPTQKLFAGSENRIRLNQAVQDAIAQVREYRDYFEDPRKRKTVMDKYGMTAYRPSAAIVIGRQEQGLPDEKVRQVLDSLPSFTKLITYDQLFAKMKNMADIYGI